MTARTVLREGRLCRAGQPRSLPAAHTAINKYPANEYGAQTTFRDRCL